MPRILGKFKFCGSKLVLTDVSTPRQKTPENCTSKHTLKQRNLLFFLEFRGIHLHNKRIKKMLPVNITNPAQYLVAIVKIADRKCNLIKTLVPL